MPSDVSVSPCWLIRTYEMRSMRCGPTRDAPIRRRVPCDLFSLFSCTHVRVPSSGIALCRRHRCSRSFRASVSSKCSALCSSVGTDATSHYQSGKSFSCCFYGILKYVLDHLGAYLCSFSRRQRKVVRIHLCPSLPESSSSVTSSISIRPSTLPLRKRTRLNSIKVGSGLPSRLPSRRYYPPSTYA